MSTQTRRSPSTGPPPSLSSQIRRTIYLFQAILAGPTFVCLGTATFFTIWNGWADLYDFTTWLCTSLMAGSIIFIVLIQRKAAEGQISKQMNLLAFEVVKTACATGLWIWLLVDACTRQRYLPHEVKMRRIAASGMAGVLLLLFYATLAQSIIEYRHSDYRDAGTGPDQDADEDTPLLRE